MGKQVDDGSDAGFEHSARARLRLGREVLGVGALFGDGGEGGSCGWLGLRLQAGDAGDGEHVEVAWGGSLLVEISSPQPERLHPTTLGLRLVLAGREPVEEVGDRGTARAGAEKHEHDGGHTDVVAFVWRRYVLVQDERGELVRVDVAAAPRVSVLPDRPSVQNGANLLPDARGVEEPRFEIEMLLGGPRHRCSSFG